MIFFLEFLAEDCESGEREQEEEVAAGVQKEEACLKTEGGRNRRHLEMSK